MHDLLLTTFSIYISQAAAAAAAGAGDGINRRVNSNAEASSSSASAPRGSLHFLKHMLAGATAGTVEHVAMFPLDTIKTRMQALPHGAPPARIPSWVPGWLTIF